MCGDSVISKSVEPYCFPLCGREARSRRTCCSASSRSCAAASRPDLTVWMPGPRSSAAPRRLSPRSARAPSSRLPFCGLPVDVGRLDVDSWGPRLDFDPVADLLGAVQPAERFESRLGVICGRGVDDEGNRSPRSDAGFEGAERLGAGSAAVWLAGRTGALATRLGAGVFCTAGVAPAAEAG